MVYDYLITLKKSDFRFVDQVSQLMYLFALLAFGFFLYKFQYSGSIYIYLLAGITIAWIVTSIRKRKKGEAFFRLGLLIAAAGWFIAPERNFWMGALYTLAALLEKQVKFPQEVGFSESGVSFNTLPKKSLQWMEINNALIKEGILTIDQKNNKLFQKEIEGFVTGDVEKEFNIFCLNQINKTQPLDGASRRG